MNEVMTSAPNAGHARSLSIVSPRKLWLAHEKDVVIVPTMPSEYFRSYVASITNVHPSSVLLSTPPGPPTEHLAHRLVRSDEFDKIRRCIWKNDVGCMVPFAQDRPTVRLADNLDLNIEGYDEKLLEKVVDLNYDMNSKYRFQCLMRELGFSVPEAVTCSGLAALTATVRDMLAQHAKVIIKFDRSSNGYGNTVVSRSVLQSDVFGYLYHCFSAWPEQPFDFIVEPFIRHVHSPSVEILVTAYDVLFLYSCDQRTINNGWSGMITPPNIGGDVDAMLLKMGNAFGQFVRAIGYRGICDVDCILSADGVLIATESNFRRTGGTYLDSLVRELRGDDYERSVCWVADVKDAGARIAFEDATMLLRNDGIAYNHRTGVGAILTADTVSLDGKWRYLVIAKDAGHALELEGRLQSTLGM